MRERRWILVGCLAWVLAGCGGGSGSTGLITSEDAVIDEVRRDGTCDEFEGATYCATDSPDATAPGGQSVSLVGAVPTAAPTPALTGTPATSNSTTPGAAPTPTPGAGPQPTATPGDGPTPTEAPPTSTGAPATATPAAPIPTASPADQRFVTALVDGFDPGAACATAARPAGSDALWLTAALVPIAADGPTTFPVPAVGADPIDLTLLCFADPPLTLPATLTTLADADPTVVFVLPSP